MSLQHSKRITASRRNTVGLIAWNCRYFLAGLASLILVVLKPSVVVVVFLWRWLLCALLQCLSSTFQTVSIRQPYLPAILNVIKLLYIQSTFTTWRALLFSAMLWYTTKVVALLWYEFIYLPCDSNNTFSCKLLSFKNFLDRFLHCWFEGFKCASASGLRLQNSNSIMPLASIRDV